MLLLHEMGLSHEIPTAAISKMLQTLKHHYLPFFPVKIEQIPKDADPYRHIMCHCGLGTMLQVLHGCGIDVDQELPWTRDWFIRYQLPDGGLNCDEAAYSKSIPKSSIVTTVSCLEAVLFCARKPLTPAQTEFLNKGATYLLNQRLFRSRSTGQVIHQDWLEIKFPRFYDYDFLRGYTFLEKWRQHSGFVIPEDLVTEVETLVSHQMTDQGIRLKRYNLFESKSHNPNPDGTWSKGPASEFDLMKAVSFEGAICEPLTQKWNKLKSDKT